MPKSRAEVLASLRGIFADAESKSEPKAKSKPKSPSPAETSASVAAFGKFRRANKAAPVMEEPEQDEELEDEDEDESEDGDSDSNHENNGNSREDEAGDVEVAPVEELLERVEALIDFVTENSEAIKAWLAACR